MKGKLSLKFVLPTVWEADVALHAHPDFNKYYRRGADGTAVKHRFDLAILLLNNIFFAPYDLATRPESIAADSVSLVKRMIPLLKVPIIALYGWPDDPWHALTLLRTGATAALQRPCKAEEIEQALRRSLRHV